MQQGDFAMQRTAMNTRAFKGVKGTRGNGRVGKMWSGRERVGTGTGIPSVFRPRPRLPDPFLALVSVPAVYRPDLRHLGPSRLLPVPP